MKKNFSLIVENKNPARQLDAIKHDIKKYVARERRKDIPEGSDFWDFNCRVGLTEDGAQETHLSQINKTLDQLVTDGAESFFVEIKAISKKRKKTSQEKN